MSKELQPFRTYQDFLKEDPQIIRCYESVGTVFIHVCRAFCFLETFVTAPNQKGMKNGALKFIKDSSQFMMVVQFLNLFESKKIENEWGIASLYKLNTLLCRAHQEYKDNYYKECKKLIGEIMKSDLFSYFILLRHNCYAHSTDHTVNPSYKFESLTIEQVKQMKHLILLTEKVIKHIRKFYDNDVTFHNWYASPVPETLLTKVQSN